MSDSTDDLTPDMTAVASAYLDGEVTPEEQARVEADSALQAEVERLRQVRAVLGDTDPAPISMREEQLASALGVWDRMSEAERSGDATPVGAAAAGAASITTPQPTSLSSRRERRGDRSKWLLGAAAALVIVAGAGVVLRDVINDSDSSDTAGDSASTEAPADVAMNETDEIAERAADDFGGGDAESEFVPTDPDAATGAPLGTDSLSASEAEESDDVLTAEEPTEAASEPAADDQADGASEPAADDGAGTISPEGTQPSPPPDVDVAILETPADLAEFGQLAVNPTATTLPGLDLDPSFPTCDEQYDFEYNLGPAQYRGKPVYVGVDLDEGSRGSVIAYDEECFLVQSTLLP
jgi:hypothetical protein